MESITLIKNRHKLYTGEGNNAMYNSEGSLLVFDMIDGKLISVPVSEESLAFFDLQQII